MSNFQEINNDDILDNQQTADISTINTNILNINNKLGGSTSSGLKTLINDNTATITTNQTNIGNLNSYPSSDATKMGFISITQNCNLDDIESDTNTNNLKVGITSSQQTKLGNITITSAKNLDTMEANITTNTTTNTNQGTLISNNSTTNTNQGILISNNTTSITGIKNNTLSSSLKSAVDTNSSKLSFPSSLNNLLSVSDTYELEVGNGVGIPRIRLRGANGTAISSELIFIDSTTNNAEYFQGATIRFNSSSNRLEFGTDQGNDNNPEGAMFINRKATPDVEIFRLIVPTTFTLMGLDQYPRQNFMYARRIKLVGSATTPDEWNVPISQSGIIWNNVIINGSLSYNSTTGILTTSTTGLFKIKAKICVATSSAQRVMKLGLKSGTIATGTDVIFGKNHLSRHESNNGSFSAPEIDGNVRLQSGINYIFFVECLNDGDGIIKNQQNENNDLCIEQLVLPSGYTLPTDYSPV